jgi:predicted nucleic acid-binding protein
MKNGLVIADAGPIFSLATVDKLELLNQLFDEVKIAKAVWDEITFDKSAKFYNKIEQYFKPKTTSIKGFNELTFVMDYGESESIILYRELNANFLLIDDKKARKIAENFNIKCIGTLGLLAVAKDKGLIKELRPIFKAFLENN